MIYLKILLLALALFLLLRSACLYLPLFLENKKMKSFAIRLFPALELIIWVGFAMWSFSKLFANSAYYNLIMAVLILLLLAILAWYLLRDVISGFILRSENAFEPGQVIKTDSTEGIIKKISYRSIEIISNNGQNMKIPYTLLINNSIIRPQDNSKWVGNTITLEFSTTLDSTKVKNLLKKRVMEMPWIVSQESIKLDLKVNERDNTIVKYSANIYFYSITAESAIKIEENLKEFIKEFVE